MTAVPEVGPASGDYYYCLTHHAVERGAGCRALDRMGPYPSAEAAASWEHSVEANNDRWDAEDRKDSDGTSDDSDD